MRSRRVVDWVGRAVLTGALAGIGIGVGLRLAMRMAAIMDPRPVEFTAGGTAFVLLVGIVVGSVLGLLFAAVRRPLGPTAGAVFGLASALLVGFVLLADPEGEARVVGEPWVNALTFPGSVLFAGLALPSLSRWAGRHERLSHRVGLGTVIGAVVGGMVGTLVVPVAGLLLGRLNPGELLGVAPVMGLQLAIAGAVLGALLVMLGSTWPVLARNARTGRSAVNS